jgi:hypothetical protein
VTDLQPTTKAEIVATSLRSIWEDRGRLAAEDVVGLAAGDAHPLHPFFEWNDDIAGHNYRVWQAGQLIRSVKILVTGSLDTEPEEFRIREWVPARAVGMGSGTYVPEETIREDPQRQARLLRQMRRDIDAVRRRYQHLDAFWKALRELTEGPPEA